MYVCIVYCCGCLFVVLYVSVSSLSQVVVTHFTVHVKVHVCGKLWGICIWAFTGNDSH